MERLKVVECAGVVVQEITQESGTTSPGREDKYLPHFFFSRFCNTHMLLGENMYPDSAYVLM